LPVRRSNNSEQENSRRELAEAELLQSQGGSRLGTPIEPQ